jgi:hypothetical protein
MNARRVLKFLEDGIATVMDLRPSAPTAEQRALAQRLAAELRALNDARQTGEGSPFWRETCLALGRLAIEGDPMFFMRWPMIQATMVHGATPAIIADWWRLRRSSAWRDVWAPALRHRHYGHPPPFPPMPSTNAMAIEHATHLQRFHELAGTRFHDSGCIVEFGGGFGSMCRLIRATGFGGTYIIFDLPHVLALQRYYLSLHGITAGDDPDGGVRLCADLDEVGAYLDAYGGSAFSAISTWAMSEMPLSLRARIETLIERPGCARLLLAYQARFETNDNLAYFRVLEDRLSGSMTMSHAPVRAPAATPSPDDSFYLFGVRR